MDSRYSIYSVYIAYSVYSIYSIYKTYIHRKVTKLRGEMQDASIETEMTVTITIDSIDAIGTIDAINTIGSQP